MTHNTNSLPLVSIITPSFNHAHFIRSTIESIISQNYPNLELIVIDGGSTDETVSILREYQDKLTWISEPDNGQTDAINKGMRLAKGDIIAYLNSDDTYEPGSLGKVVETFSQNPDVDLIYGDFNYVDVDGKLVSHRYSIDFDYGIFRYDHCFICQPSSFWRRSVNETIGLFKEDLFYYMDYDFYLRAAAAGLRFHHIHQPLANLRLHADCKTVSGSVDARNKMLIERNLVLAPYRFDLGASVLTRSALQVFKLLYRLKKSLRLLVESGHLEFAGHRRLMNSVYNSDA